MGLHQKVVQESLRYLGPGGEFDEEMTILYLII